MKPLPPSWALGAQAMDAAGDPHLRPGRHFRLAVSPALGLPLRPLLVYRHTLHPSQMERALRTDIRWEDSRGRRLTAPFDVTPDNPVTGYLPVNLLVRCSWIQVLAGSPTDLERVREGAPPLSVAGAREVLAARRFTDLPPLTHVPETHVPETHVPETHVPGTHAPLTHLPETRLRLDRDILDLIRRIPRLPARNTLRVDAFRTTSRGLQILASRDAHPYAIGASEIAGVTVSGRGRVEGVRWLTWGQAQIKRAHWRVLPMPVDSGPRYEAPADARDQALERVARGAPLRLGAHDRPDAATPTSTPVANEAAELRRVNHLTAALAPALKELVEDTSVPPQQIALSETLDQGPELGEGVDPPTASFPALHTALLGSLDPGICRWLGFMDQDDEQELEPGTLVLYLIRGFWAVDWNSLPLMKQAAFWPAAAAGFVSPSAPDEPGLPFSLPRESPDGFPVFDLEIPAIATVGVPPARPPAPAMDGPVPPEGSPDGDPLGTWMAGEPPEQHRHVELPIRNLVPGACLAVSRRPEDGEATGLNRRVVVDEDTGEDRALSLHAALPGDAETPHEARIGDREAPGEAVTYRAAQADWFGRWSGWANRQIPPRSRPEPPVPSLEPWYAPPDVPDPVHDAPLWGRLVVKVPVPGADSLAPGSHPLARLHLTGTIQPDGPGGTHPVGETVDVPSPAPAELEVEVPVPTGAEGEALLLGRAASARVLLRARWIDEGNRPSAFSEEREVRVVDPRPPEAVELDPELRYTARPDATGRAQARLSWPVSGAQRRFRVFFSDETRLVERLEAQASGSDDEAAEAREFLEALETAEGPAARAEVFADEDRRRLLSRDWFQNLTGEPLVAGTADRMSFSTDVSGSLEGLVFFRVVALSEHNVESDFAGSPVVPMGVPNSGPPPRPMLEVVGPGDEPEGMAAPEGAVLLRVRVIQGAQPVTRLRLRRSSRSGADVLAMPLAQETEVTPGEPGPDGAVLLHLVDEGAYLHDPGRALRPFTRYYWRVEVQAPEEPGSDVPGEWSLPSDPASTLLVGPEPTPPEELEVTGLEVSGPDPSGPTVTLQWTHPDPLLSGGMGGYRFEILRRMPEKGTTRAGVLAADAPPESGGRTGPDEPFRWEETFADPQDPPSGTSYQVVTVDPLGRRSTPSGHAAVPDA